MIEAAILLVVYVSIAGAYSKAKAMGGKKYRPSGAQKDHLLKLRLRHRLRENPRRDALETEHEIRKELGHWDGWQR